MRSSVYRVCVFVGSIVLVKSVLLLTMDHAPRLIWLITSFGASSGPLQLWQSISLLTVIVRI